MWGLVQARVSLSCLHSSHNRCRDITTAVLDLTSVDGCQWPGENNAWDTPSPTASIAVATIVYFVNPHSKWKVTQQNTLTGEHSRRGMLRGFSPSASTLILPIPTSYHRGETQHRNKSGASTTITREQTLPLIGQWQSQSREEAQLDSQCRLLSPQCQSHLLSREKQPAYTEGRSDRYPYLLVALVPKTY